MTDHRFEQSADGTWTVQVFEALLLLETCDRVVGVLSDPAVAQLGAVADDGTEWTITELIGMARDAAVVVGEGIDRAVLDDAAFERFVAAVGRLGVLAGWAADALADGSAEREHEFMGMIDRLGHLFDRATRSLYATVVPLGDGRFRLRWTDRDREMIRVLSEDLDALLDSDDHAVMRLFPPAYGDDAERSRGYDALARGELIESRRAALGVLGRALGEQEVGADSLAALMRAVNDLRLVLGTRLGIEDDDDPRRHASGPDAATWAAYERLSHLLSDVVAALGS